MKLLGEWRCQWSAWAWVMVLVGLSMTGCRFDPGVDTPCSQEADCDDGESCLEGVCVDEGEGFGFEECAADELRCDGECVNIASDPEHCGACFEACQEGDACVEGVCEVADCADGEELCDGQCVDVTSSEEHCGQCGVSCGGDQFCDDGICEDVPIVCDAGELVCQGQCVDPSVDVEHCGGCGNACGDGQICEAGSCVDEGGEEPDPEECPDGLEACGDQCVDVMTDDENCGECGNACGDGESCEAGVCEGDDPQPEPCDDGLEACGDQCVDLMTDEANCGECGNACGDGESCEAGVCEEDDPEPEPCDDGLEECGDQCVDLMTDDANCGQCGNVCDFGEACMAGVCGTDDDPDPQPDACDVDASPFGGGEGTESEPYLICSADHLAAIGDDDGDLGAWYEMADDVDATGVTMGPIGVSPLDFGDWDGGFQGVFDGQGYVLTGLNVESNGAEMTGLFGVIDGGEVRDLELDQVSVEGGDFTGGVAGINDGEIVDVVADVDVEGGEEVGGIAGYSASGATVSGVSVHGSVSGQQSVGGLVGRNDGTIIGGTSHASITGVDLGGTVGLIGGAIGDNHEDGVCQVQDVHATGTVSSEGTAIGGLLGRNHVGCQVIDGSASGDVEASGASAVGGLIGWSRPESRTIDGEATGDVEGLEFVGGFIGRLSSVDGEDWSEEDGQPPVVGALAQGEVMGAESVGGLVGRAEGTVSGSTAEGDVSGGDWVGGLVGHLRETDFGTAGAVVGSGASGDVAGDERVGGLVGYQQGPVDNSWAEGDVLGVSQVGGLVGRADDEIFGSWASGEVIDTNDFGVRFGGLVGELEGTIDQSYAEGQVTISQGNSVGGLVGRVNTAATVVDSYALGGVEGSNYVGGLVGVLQGSGAFSSDGEVQTSFSSGAVSGSSGVGGLVGSGFVGGGGTVSASYWNRTTSGQSDSYGGEDILDGAFGEASSFSGFDFIDVWTMPDGLGRPELQWVDEAGL